MSYPQQPWQPPSKPKPWGLIMALGFSLAFLAMIGASALVVASRSDDDTPAAQPTAGSTTGTPTESPTATPTETPSETPTEAPTESPSETPTPTEEPTEEPSDPVDDGHLSESDFRDDWDFKFLDTELTARHSRGWDYPTCNRVEAEDNLTDQGCRRAVSVTYFAERQNLQLTHIILETASTTRARNLSDAITDADVRVRPEAFIEGFRTGMWKSSASDKYVVFSVVTATGKVKKSVAEDYLRWANSDVSTSLLF